MFKSAAIFVLGTSLVFAVFMGNAGSVAGDVVDAVAIDEAELAEECEAVDGLLVVDETEVVPSGSCLAR